MRGVHKQKSSIQLNRFCQAPIIKSQVTFLKQDIPFEAEPNVAVPHVEMTDEGLILDFAIRGFAANDYGSDSHAKILFTEVIMYRVGDPNDEGFYLFGGYPGRVNDSIYSRKVFPNLDFGCFYKVENVNWKKDLLGKVTCILDQNYSEKVGFSHFVFFMKDGTFECVAKDYTPKSTPQH